MDAYHILERIGEGSFGKVYRGRRKYSGHVVALKFVTKRGKNAKELQSLRDEVSRASATRSFHATVCLTANTRLTLSLSLWSVRSASCGA